MGQDSGCLVTQLEAGDGQLRRRMVRLSGAGAAATGALKFWWDISYVGDVDMEDQSFRSMI
jgi:hypothetical protein